MREAGLFQGFFLLQLLTLSLLLIVALHNRDSLSESSSDGFFVLAYLCSTILRIKLVAPARPLIFLPNNLSVNFLFLLDISVGAIALVELRFHLLGNVFNVDHEPDIEAQDIFKAWGQERDS